jgi:glycerol-3-phosphate dehydrogenase
LRVIREAVRAGGAALNYASVEHLLRRQSGQVCGVALRDRSPEGAERTIEIQAAVVINATGAWADALRGQVGGRQRLRKLRGSHLVFPWSKLPLTRGVNLMNHPSDGRSLYVFPWEGVTLVGTTDVDHGERLETEVRISLGEVDYLMAAVSHLFPSLALTESDVQASFAGVRAVVDTGKADPSKESREFVLWDEQGLLTVTGGKLTTFRLMAHDALRAVRQRLPGTPKFDAGQGVLDAPPDESTLGGDVLSTARLRLLGRYGADAREVIAAAQPDELRSIGDAQSVASLWAELRWAARAEGVIHLDDLLLRRVRLGLILPQGGLAWLERIRAIVQPELGWEDARWAQEAAAYARLWQGSYSLPSVRSAHFSALGYPLER